MTWNVLPDSVPKFLPVVVRQTNIMVNFVYTQFLYSFRSFTSSLQCTSPLACAAGHAPAFTVNAHWWRVSGSTARELFPCTLPSTLSTRLERPQVSFFKFSAWPDRESNPVFQLWWRVLKQLRPWIGSNIKLIITYRGIWYNEKFMQLNHKIRISFCRSLIHSIPSSNPSYWELLNRC